MVRTISTRRDFLKTSALASAGAVIGGRADRLFAEDNAKKKPFFRTRGVILRPKDTLIADWPERAKRAGLTTISTHPFPGTVIALMKTEEGKRFFDKCRELGLQVEHELHAMRELLPRGLFAKNPEMFRMDDKGERTPVANCCPSSPQGLEVIAESAVKVAKALPSTTGRYFLWGDDMVGWCQCPKCRELLPSEQSLTVMNRISLALREHISPTASIAHLAYQSTLQPPKQVKPAEGVFLEYAAGGWYEKPFVSLRKEGDYKTIYALDANLEVFPKDTAQVLTGWLDVGAYTGRARSKEPVKLPWKKEPLLADLAYYRKLGVRNFTAFATGVNPDYQKLHGDLSFIDEYGACLMQ